MRWLLIAALILLSACNGAHSAQSGNATPNETIQQPQADSGAPSPPAADTPTADDTGHYTYFFSPGRAFSYLEHQVEMGFRVPGSHTHRECAAWLEETLEKYCDQVRVQEFQVNLPTGPTKMWNIIGRINPQAERRIILGAHWDTRPTADYNPPGMRDRPIPGANDGASGTAVLLELAKVFSEVPPAVGIDIVLFDGEDYGPSLDMMFFGSEYFASQLTETEARAYNYGILLDMIGDKQLNIHPESHSEGQAGLVFQVAYEVSRDLGYYAFKKSGTKTIFDDHIPLLERGVRMYNFIDFEYPDRHNSYWHTTRDTVDKCSKDSLEVVGRVVENMVYLYPHLYAPD